MKEFKCESNVGMLRGSGDIVGKCILNSLKAFNLHDRKSMVKRVAIIKTGVSEGSSDSSGSGKVKSVTDTMKVTNMVMSCATKCRNLFGNIGYCQI